MAGFYALVSDEGGAELDFMFVADKAQGLGIGRLLFEHMKAAARTLGHDRVLIVAHPPAEPFYKDGGGNCGQKAAERACDVEPAAYATRTFLDPPRTRWRVGGSPCPPSTSAGILPISAWASASHASFLGAPFCAGPLLECWPCARG